MLTLENTVTIGMSAHGNAITTAHALACLKASATGDYEVILVDDCSTDNGEVLRLFQDFSRQHQRTRIFHFDRNLEYTGSLNAILSHAVGTEILFISNDIYVTPSYLREILAIARAIPRHGIVRGCSNFVDNGRPSHNIAVDRPVGNFEQLSAFAAHIEGELAGQTLHDDYLIGDAFLIKRAVLDRIGTLDPLFYGYFADPDLGLRAQGAGFDIVLARGAFAAHKQAANFEYLPKPEQEAKLSRRWYRVVENWARFKMKYGMPVDLLYTSVNDIPWRMLADERAPSLPFIPPGDYSRFELGKPT